MKNISPYPNKISAIERALRIAREEGECVFVGEIPQEIRLICFDMDATLIQTETINEIANAGGIGEQMRELTMRAMCGGEDFRTNFIRRVKMLKGVPVSIIEEIAANAPYAKGLYNLMDKIHKAGIESAVISGNFNIFEKHLKNEFGFNHIYTVTPEIENGTLTGNICGDIIDAPAKSSILKKICSEKNISTKNTVAVGDGANDIPMLATASLAIAYNAIYAKERIDEIISFL